MTHICDHCHLDFSEEALIKEETEDSTLYFCCKGCQGVYHLLHDEGLGSFYDKLGNGRLTPVKKGYEELSRFDSAAFAQKYVRKSDGFKEVSLVIEGIHCAACVWLNEKVLNRTDGIFRADINYTNNKATIRWDDAALPLSKVVETIRSIGYNAHPYDPRVQEERADKSRRDYYFRMIVGLFCTMNIMWLAIAKWSGYFTGIDPQVKFMLSWAEWALATPALFYAGWIFFRGAYYGIKHRFINMDLLVASGASLTYVYSVYALLSGYGETYFESVAMIITFVLIGKFLEVRTKKSAVDVLDSLNAQIPAEVTVEREGAAQSVSVEEVAVGEVVLLKPGEKAAVDGVLLSDLASFDESALTGESLPVVKQQDERVFGATVNLDGAIRYRATKTFADSTLHHLLGMVEEALAKKPVIEKNANELSRMFSAFILLIAIGTFMGWYIGIGGLEKALMASIAVIVIACPCALALATPIATLVGIGTAYRNGLLFKEARMLETMAKADVLLLDKTGTLTRGKPQVVEEKRFGEFDSAMLRGFLSLSNHPISSGIYHHLEDAALSVNTARFEDFIQYPARGIRAVHDGKQLFGGNAAFLREQGVAVDATLEACQFLFASDRELFAAYRLEDALKPDADAAIRKLKGMGLTIEMLTGDRQERAQRIADQLGIGYRAELTPEMKADVVGEYQQENRIVVMVGDGINDSVVLGKSDIGIAMGSGTDIALSVSDVVLLNNSMESLKEAFYISRRTYGFIKQNMAISLLYNALTIPLAVAGYVIPLIAALSMSLSSVIVVLNSLRIRR